MLLIYCQYLFNINGNNVVEEYHLKEIRSWLLCSDWMLSFLFGRITKPLRRNVKRFIFVSLHDAVRLVELFSIRFICTQWNLHARHRKFGLITSACFIPGCLSALWEALILRQLNSLSVSRLYFQLLHVNNEIWRFHWKDTQTYYVTINVVSSQCQILSLFLGKIKKRFFKNWFKENKKKRKI